MTQSGVVRKTASIADCYHKILVLWGTGRFVEDRECDTRRVVAQLANKRVDEGPVLRALEGLTDIVRSVSNADVRCGAMMAMHGIVLSRGMSLSKEFFIELLRVASSERNDHVFGLFGFIFDGQAKNGHRRVFLDCIRNELRDLRTSCSTRRSNASRLKLRRELDTLAEDLAPRLRGKRRRALEQIRKLRAILEGPSADDDEWSSGVADEIEELERQISENFPDDFPIERAQMRPLEEALAEISRNELREKRLLELLRR